MKNRIIGKGFVIVIILLFVGSGIIPSTVGIIENTNIRSNLGSGGYIQGLIDNATAGDTIYVPSGIYYENIIINKSISLIGEDKNTTIIDGNHYYDVVFVDADYVNISGFTLQNCGGTWFHAGIKIVSDCNSITNNKILDNIDYAGFGIMLSGSSSNIISDNTISDNYYGISLSGDSNTIIGNTISNSHRRGISLHSSNNSIMGNSFLNDGLYVDQSYHNNVENNTVNGKPLVYLEDESNKVIDDAGQVLLINCDDITIQNQKISNTTVGILLVNTTNTLIHSNTISCNNESGIHLVSSNHNIIMDNTISLNAHYGMDIRYGSISNNIKNNTITNNGYGGIYLFHSTSNNIKGNIITSHDTAIAIRLSHSSGNLIESNHIISNYQSIYYSYSSKNIITKNNFIKNGFIHSSFYYHCGSASNIREIIENITNLWSQNYWNRPRILPKVIPGIIQLSGPSTGPFIIWFNIDWRPALKPYDIKVGI